MADELDIVEQYRRSKIALMHDRIKKLERSALETEKALNEMRSWAKQINSTIKELKR